MNIAAIKRLESPNPRRKNMQANRRRDTGPEIALRRLLFARGLRYFVDRRPLKDCRWRADVIFPTERVAVFVDGCYWHGCPEHFSTPRVNTEYWASKIAANRARDERFDGLLAEAGWAVIRAWEHEDASNVADAVVRAVKQRRESAG